jgi:hypothetical protein
MIKFLRRNQQFFIFFIFLYCAVAVFSIYFTQPFSKFTLQPFHFPFFMDLYLVELTNNKLYLVFALVVYITLLVAGFYLVRIGISNMIITRRSQFSALFLISISTLAFRYEIFSGISIAAIFLLFAIDRLIGSVEKKGRSYRLLDAGLILALGSLFYFNLIFLIPFLWIAQWLLRPLSWRELSYTVFGLVLPVIYLLAGSYLLDQPFGSTLQYLKDWVMLRKVLEPGWHLLAGIGLYVLSLLIASLFAIRKFNVTKIQTRKLYQLFFFLFLNIVLILLIIPSTGLEILFLFAIPSSIVLSIYFTDCRPGFFNGVLFLLLILSPVLINLLI